VDWGTKFFPSPEDTNGLGWLEQSRYGLFAPYSKERKTLPETIVLELLPRLQDWPAGSGRELFGIGRNYRIINRQVQSFDAYVSKGWLTDLLPHGFSVPGSIEAARRVEFYIGANSCLALVALSRGIPTAILEPDEHTNPESWPRLFDLLRAHPARKRGCRSPAKARRISICKRSRGLDSPRMETLQLLGVALGLASLAGLNLYLTVFATGLSIQQQWLDVSHTYPQLEILGHPAIVAISGVLFLLQFFADKVPWVDSLWDAVHTLIRPVGGAFLAVSVLGSPDPVFDVIIALLAGGATLMVHGAKAGTRFVVNHSPEPFSNIALSIAEDITVLGGLVLLKNDPQLALAVFGAALLMIAYFGPKLFRAARVNTWLLWRKVTAPSADDADGELPRQLPHELDLLLASRQLTSDQVAWAVPCASVSAREVPGNVFGHLVATAGEPRRLRFLAARRWRPVAAELDLTTYKAAHESKFLSENVVLYSLEKKPKYVFLFDRGQRAVAREVARALQVRLAPPLAAPALA